MGVFSFDDKVELEGGEKIDTDAGWASSDTPGIVNKAIVGQTKTGNYIVFTIPGVSEEAHPASVSIFSPPSNSTLSSKEKTPMVKAIICSMAKRWTLHELMKR